MVEATKNAPHAPIGVNYASDVPCAASPFHFITHSQDGTARAVAQNALHVHGQFTHAA
jgi:hypothetical protein